MAYVANGDLPPLRLPHPIITDGLIAFAISTTACLALGVLIGSAVA
ncbi:hypothetical protein ACFQU7_10835 [Pseudoroseomonas wenyumeiae]